MSRRFFSTLLYKWFYWNHRWHREKWPSVIFSCLYGRQRNAFVCRREVSLDFRNIVNINLLRDTRQKSAPKHELGVCVQPIYLHTDFSAFVQFFEFWLAENTTKFYVYRESYTPEVGELLDFYANSSGVEFEFIDWTALPMRKEPNEHLAATNPNRFWFRLEVFMSIFDCVHRAK